MAWQQTRLSHLLFRKQYVRSRKENAAQGLLLYWGLSFSPFTVAARTLSKKRTARPQNHPIQQIFELGASGRRAILRLAKGSLGAVTVTELHVRLNASHHFRRGLLAELC